MNKLFTTYTLKNIQSQQFLMTPLELKDYIDFDVKRIYFISHAQGNTSQHMHYKEKELFILLQGNCTGVIDKGEGREDIPMKGGVTALYIPNYVWHGFKDFSEDAILLAVSSTNYSPDRSDYLDDYDEYVRIRDEKLKELYSE